MKGDFTRDTFDPRNHFSRVLAQQGRVTVDADSNEQTSILLHYIRTLARDLIGPYAAPVIDGGFALMADEKGLLWITPGRFYVDGILVENDAHTLYTGQHDYPLPADDALAKEINSNTGQPFWVYLDVWERHVTYLEADLIREKALGGADTSTRAQVVWQVKAIPFEEPLDPAGTPNGTALPCEAPLTGLVGVSKASMKARVDPGQRSDSPCTLPPDAKYRGAENQLYRVEIHDGGKAGTATFKWARDNGSVVAAWLANAGPVLKVSQTRGFAAGQWVEILTDVHELQGIPGFLVKLSSVDSGGLTVDETTVPEGETITWSDQLINPRVRRWDQVQIGDIVLRNGSVLVTEVAGEWIDLEDGLQIQFAPGGEYRPGDFWQIPARVATGQVEWPGVESESGFVPDFLPPDGIVHHYAPLGFTTWKDRKMTLGKCRCEFEPLSSCFVPGSATRDGQLVVPNNIERPSVRTPPATPRGRRRSHT